MPKYGALLLNLGTPRSPKTPDVAAYLREFFADPGVLGLPALLRWPLVNFWIVPRRAPHSAEKYQKIWTPAGSPLQIHTHALRAKVQEKMPIPVAYAMRYGEPNIPDALEALGREVEEILLLPLYPQYADATVGSSIEVVRAQAKKWKLKIRYLNCFYDQDSFLEAWKAVYRDHIPFAADHLLFTFHGLPMKQIQSQNCGSFCFSQPNCCETISAKNAHCYRAQCYATARGLADKLGRKPGDWSVSFQSRLGRGEWIRPYTDEVLAKLASQGKKQLAVISPAFVADCLETLEEIGIEGEKIFRQHGGESFTLVECLNSHPAWVEAVAGLIRAGMET